MTALRGWAAAAATALAALALPALTQAAPSWRLEQPAPPAGAPFKVPLGAPGDIEFYAPNRGLMTVEGNATIARGLYYYNGVNWRQLSTVCGGSGDSSRIAWAGPDEFWTVTEPSLPRTGGGQALCHFKDGQVVASYSTPSQSPDPFHAMDSAACNGPNDCWFGGIGASDPTGTRVGAFHLHWDGNTLSTVYAPQGRGVSAITQFGGTFYESTFVGIQREDNADVPSLVTPEPQPLLIHTIAGTRFRDAPFFPAQRIGVPTNGTELLDANADATDLWFVGGGAASGPAAPDNGSVARPPIAIHLNGAFYQELALPDSAFGPTDRFGAVAAVPGTSNAWVTVVPFAQRGSTTAKAHVALLSANGRILEQDTLPTSGAGRGAASRIACTAPNDCWLATTAGWVFHYTDGTPLPPDTDPNFASLITVRPNESTAQFVPDTPPADDSQINAPPPPVVEPPPPPAKAKKLKALVFGFKKPKVLSLHHGKVLMLELKFSVRRSATIQLLAKRGGKVVAKTPVWHVHPGPVRIRLQLDRKHWPTALQLKTHEKNQKASGGSGNDDTTVLT